MPVAFPPMYALLVALRAFTAQPPTPDSSIISTAEMTQYLRKAEEAQANQQISFEATWYYGEGQDVPPEAPDASHLVYTQHFTSLLSDERYRIEVRFLDAHPKVDGVLGHTQVYTWNGQEARVSVIDGQSQNPKRQTVRIDSLPTRDVTDSAILYWCGWWVFQGPYFVGYADVLESAAPDPEPAISGGTEWRVTSRTLQYTEMVFRAERRGDRIVIRSVEQSSYADEESFDSHDPLRAFVSSELSFEGDIVEAIGFPMTATLVTSHRPTDASAEFWNKATITCKGLAPVATNDETFLVRIDEGAIVGDSRYNISYQLGTREINVDGALYETTEPLHGDVGANLRVWVRQSRLLATTGRAASDPEPAAPQ